MYVARHRHGRRDRERARGERSGTPAGSPQGPRPTGAKGMAMGSAEYARNVAECVSPDSSEPAASHLRGPRAAEDFLVVDVARRARFRVRMHDGSGAALAVHPRARARFDAAMI